MNLTGLLAAAAAVYAVELFSIHHETLRQFQHSQLMPTYAEVPVM
jgi:hypothetical protein